MLDVTTFLIRWLFLSNLARDVAEIQTLPWQPYHYYNDPPHPHDEPGTGPAVASQHAAQHEQQQQNPLQHAAQQQQQHSSSGAPPAVTTAAAAALPASGLASRHGVEERWRDDCIRGILSYPPGQQRLFVMDAIRIELVQELARLIRNSSDVLRRKSSSIALVAAAAAVAATARTTIHNKPSDQLRSSHAKQDGAGVDGAAHGGGANDADDPFLDADLEILEAFGRSSHEHGDVTGRTTTTTHPSSATLVISGDKTAVVGPFSDEAASPTTSVESDPSRATAAKHHTSYSDAEAAAPPPSDHEVNEARRNLREAKDYLPQLVAAVLRSPPAFDPRLANPVQKLRQLLLHRCSQDPGFGVDLCWLLEAEVGRAWKTLFEHRQQSGRRLIVVLAADKAAVLAKIGNEKRGAFDLLQDAEQATAYGYTFDPEGLAPASLLNEREECGVAPRLPSSLSLRRCSHFGDTMHFVDRLTKVSMDLRFVPTADRLNYLHEALHEMNRRIRRRMVSRGDISLDVEDNQGPFDWPSVEDLTLDMLHSSVHFPLVPQKGIWPDGRRRIDPEAAAENPSVEVVRVLNIVVPEARILASRERCPFLVHMEVADTDMEASDARLYATGAQALGSTVEEALGMSPATAGAAAAAGRHSLIPPSYEIPQELVRHQGVVRSAARGGTGELSRSQLGKLAPRGGWQADEMFFDDGYTYRNPLEAARQHEYEELHLQMQPQPQQHGFQNDPAFVSPQRPTASVGADLLNKVYGQPWESKCQEIRQASPFGDVKGWRLASFIMKAGEDIRREALVMQVISKLRTWFREIPEQHRPVLRPYTIMTVGGDAGMIECLSDAKSVDEVKKRTDGFVSLREYFERAYGPPSSAPQRGSVESPLHLDFETAQDNFLRSLVGYSLVCYILQIKDRHNANILLDRDGHIMHIDFGFVLGDTPKMGKVPIFSERAPFKLSSEFWEVLGGWNIHSGGLGVRFCEMFEHAFACASSHADEIATLVESIMEMLTANAASARSIANSVRSRLRMRGPPGSVKQKSFVVDIVNAALTCWGTSTYDWLQRSMNGYQ